MLLRDLVTSGSTIGEVEFIFEFECEFVRVLAWISEMREFQFISCGFRSKMQSRCWSAGNACFSSSSLFRIDWVKHSRGKIKMEIVSMFPQLKSIVNDYVTLSLNKFLIKLKYCHSYFY